MSEQHDPFGALAIDTARFDPNDAQQLLIAITNELTSMYQKSNDNRQRIINLGSAPKKAEGYDAINTERYDVEHRIEALKVKWNTVSQILYWKGGEMRHWAKAA
jgi:hypothetical protein